MKGRRLTEAQKGRMARHLVYFCVAVLTIAAVWSLVIKTYGVTHDVAVDLSDVLTFIGAAFGGELLMLLAKRIFAKSHDNKEETP